MESDLVQFGTEQESDQRGGQKRHMHHSSTDPMWSKLALTTSPGEMAMAAVSAPERTSDPARNDRPREARL